MLVIHGELDRRVPISESLRLWWDLIRHADKESPHRFLHFPDEGHEIHHPRNIKIWYESILQFLRTHLPVATMQAPPPEALT